MLATAATGVRVPVMAMMLLAVVSDACLIPFYPQFFSARYGIGSAVHAGAYVAAISVAVMCTLPLWARVAQRVEPIRLLVYTQCAAGGLCLLSLWAPGIASFWVLSLLMFMCKSSYLLMYPYLMRLTPKDRHAATIGALSVVVHFGAIFGAAVGGFVLEAGGPRTSILAMAAADFLQMALCIGLIRSGRMVRVNSGEHALVGASAGASAGASSTTPAPPRFDLRAQLPILRLASVMLVFDFSAYLIRPFFSVYWQQVTGRDSAWLAGLAFAIPGLVAIAALALQARRRQRGGHAPDHTLGNLLLGAVGLLLHAAPEPALIVLGRLLYGWALFQIVVRLELSLFRLSTPQRYARDYGITNFFQNLGVLLASFAAGVVVDRHGLQLPFLLAALGFALTALLERAIVKLPGAGVRHEEPAHAR